MAENEDVFEDWDADFLDQLIQVEEHALASANPTQLPKPQLPPVRPPLPPPSVSYSSAASFTSKSSNEISYSPPRQLSQRPSDLNAPISAPQYAQEIEIERLKRELERVSNQVNGLEQECMELKRERDKKDKQLKSVLSKADAKKPEDNCMRAEISGRESDVLVRSHPGVSSKCQGANTYTEGAGQLKSKVCQAIGIQTDPDEDLPNFDVKEEPNTDSFLQKNLQSIWSSSSGHRSRSFIKKLLVTCTSDFCDLFSYLGLKTSIRTTDSLEREVSSCIASGNDINSFNSAESTRISDLCSVLTKIRDGMIQVQSEAVSIMNAILVRTNGFSEREEYGEPVVFEAVANLLRKEADLSLRREAVRLLHLLLNCPKLLAKFCLGRNDLEKHAEATDGVSSAVSHIILQGLADCIGQYGNGAQDINLRRNATVVLAFLTSSGTPGFEIVLSHKLSNGVNFLGLILRVVASDIDAEASESEPSFYILKERTLFMREALILLNRLASNPTTSSTVLQVLTSNRDMVSLSVDVAARLSRECRQLGTSDWPMKRIRQSEVTELARVFKKRVFTYLGESASS